MKAFLIGDVHLGRKFRNKDIPIDKRGMREQILRLRFQQYVDLAIKSVKSGKYNFVIQLGDLFDSFAVNYEDLMFAYEQLSKFNREGITCYIIAGNHDLAKDTSRVNAINVLGKMLSQSDNNHVWIITEGVQVLYDNINKEQHILIPYSHESDSRNNNEPFRSLAGYKSYLYGHFDEPFPPKWQLQFEHVYTGHIHLPKEVGNVTVVGSILPLTFAEDAYNSFMRTVTLAEYEEDLKAGLSDYRCYRLKLAEGEELPTDGHYLQMSTFSSAREIEGENLDVDFETFDIEKLLHEALDPVGLFDEIFNLYTEYKLSEASE